MVLEFKWEKRRWGNSTLMGGKEGGDPAVRFSFTKARVSGHRRPTVQRWRLQPMKEMMGKPGRYQAVRRVGPGALGRLVSEKKKLAGLLEEFCAE
jgi:hypothetical protein